jgi:hypothetical protein
MKKNFALMLAALLLVSSLMMGSALAENASLGLMGGWTPAENPTVTEDVRALFDQAMEGLLGVDYVPVAYLGSQVVAGTNHAILCQATVVYPGAQPAWKIVFLYEDLTGHAEFLSIADFDFGSLCTYGAE